jgi:hypothetical protein
VAQRPEHSADILAFPALRSDDARLRDVIGEVLRDERQAQERTLSDVADAWPTQSVAMSGITNCMVS